MGKSRASRGPGSSGEPPTWAVAAVVASIGLIGLVSILPTSWRFALPFGDSDYFYIGLIFLPMIVMVGALVTSKVLEAKQAAGWSQTSAHILMSRVEARHHKFGGDTTTVTNVPVVQYEFMADGRKWHGNRISIGEDSGGANTEATLARYPKGSTVTVYYDPKNPEHCVLERDIPKGMGKGCALMAGGLIAAIVAIYYLTTNASRLLEHALPNGNAPATVFAACMGIVLLLMFFGARRMTKIATDWPFVRGKIVSSGTEVYRGPGRGTARTLYAPAVEFSYTVNGIEYHGNRIKVGVEVSGSQAYAEKIAARYPAESEVEVHYDPKNPTNAALENPTGFNWTILGLSAACFAIAVYASGYFQ